MCAKKDIDNNGSLEISKKLSRRNLVKLGSLVSLVFMKSRAEASNSSAPAKPKETNNIYQPKKSICAWDSNSEEKPAIIDVSHELSDDDLMRHETFIKEAIKLSQQAEQHCNHPFGALLVLPIEKPGHEAEYRVILKGENRVYTDGDHTQHAETRLVSDANRSAYITKDMMSRAILYTSAEPCAMCCGAIFWSGIRTVVYAAPHDSFGSSSFPVPCREVFKYSAPEQAVTVIGPVLAAESIPIVGGYFKERWRNVTSACTISNKL